MLIQSTGLGNLITELITLPVLYQLPLPLLVSWRGHGDEAIEAQTVLGGRITGMLYGLGIPFSEIVGLDDIERLNEGLIECYAQSSVKVFYSPLNSGKTILPLKSTSIAMRRGPGWTGFPLKRTLI